MTSKHLLLLAIPCLAGAAGLFESGYVKQSDGGAYLHNAYPQVARLASGKLLVVWCVDPKDKRDPYVAAALSADGGKTWGEPKVLIDNPKLWDGDPNIIVDGRRVFVYSTTHDPVLPRIDHSSTYMTRSDDEGITWSKTVEIKMPRKYVAGKQHNGLKLLDGTLVMGVAWDLWAEQGTPARTEGEMNLVTTVLRSKDGVEWTPFGELSIWEKKVAPNSTGGLCEPSIVQLKNGELFMIMRTGTSFHYESRSLDGGLTWDAPQRSSLMGHNTPSALWRLDQKPDEIIAIWNNSPVRRYPLSVAISVDGGRTWSRPRNVAESNGPQISYPGITQTSDGTFLAVWQQALPEGGRNVRWARFDREWVLEAPASQ
jgi:hypothetical protein